MHDVPNRFIAVKARPIRRRKPRIKPRKKAPVTIRFECPNCGGAHPRADCTKAMVP